MKLGKYKPINYALYGLILLTLGLIWFEFELLNFNFMRSDVLSYWNDSINWRSPFHRFHVPFFPLVITGLRGITQSLFSPLFYMISINLLSLFLGILSINQIAIVLSLEGVQSILPIFLFAFWPLAGIYSVIYPVADYVVFGLFLLGLSLFFQEQPAFGAIIWGFALITHKAIWPFIAFLFIIWLFQYLREYKWKSLLFATLMLLPLAALWFFGSQHHADPLWLVRSNIEVEFQARHTLPVFDGLIGTFLQGGISNIIKGFFVLFHYILISGFSFFLINSRPHRWQYGLAILLTLLFYGTTLNSHEIWAFVRFSKLLIIPLMIVFSQSKQEKFFDMPGIRWAAISLGTLMVFSQFVYVYYMARFFFV